MPDCVACGAELEPPVRTLHTVYVKTLYHIGGQDLPPPYHQGCRGRRRHHRGQGRRRIACWDEPSPFTPASGR